MGHPLFDAVMQSDEFRTRLENIEKNKSFNDDRKRSSPCSNTDDCVEFTTSAIDNDIDFIGSVPPLPYSIEANLAAAIGACKFNYSAKVRYRDNFILNDQYDIHITGEIYDMYDFTYGKDSFLNIIDLNTDGAAIQLGHETSRPEGAVFVTSIPFELTFGLTCSLLRCTYSENLLFSEPGDF